jgi:hypothetical protein
LISFKKIRCARKCHRPQDGLNIQLCASAEMQSTFSVRGSAIAKRGNAFDQFASALCQTLDRNGIAVANEEIERGAELPLRRPLVQIRTPVLTN